MTVSFDLTGKVAIVTGGSRGLGKDMAQGLGEAGADLAIFARNKARLDEACAELEQLTGRTVKGYSVDLSDIKAAEAAEQQVLGDFGRIDILVNNAALLKSESVDDLTEETFDLCMNANVKAPYFLSQAIVRDWMREHGGKIINICSVMTFRASDTSPIYPITKAAEAMMTKCQAMAWAQYGINVNGIAPGQMMLGMGETMTDEYVANLAKKIPQRRTGQHEDLTGACIYLASDACRYTQGQIITCDGGILLPLK